MNVPVVDDVLSSHEQEICPTTSLDENTIEFEFQTDRNVYVDLRQTNLALKSKLVKGRGLILTKQQKRKRSTKNTLFLLKQVTMTLKFIEEDEGVPHITPVNNILHSIFSNGKLNFNNHQIYKSNQLFAHKSYISNNFESTLTDYQGVLHCEGYDYEENPENLLEGPFFLRRMKLYSTLGGFMLYGKLGIDFPTTLELLYLSMKVRIRLIQAPSIFYMISENPNVSLGIVDCSLYTRRAMLKEDYHKKRMSQLAYAPVDYNYLETLAKIYIFLARQNQIVQENKFNNAPIYRISIAMKSNSAFTGSFAENPLWCQQFNLRDNRILRGRQPVVHNDTTDICRFYVTTMKAMNFQDDTPSIPVDKFIDQYVLMFELISMQDPTEHCHYPELIGEPLSLDYTLVHLQKVSQKSMYWLNVCLLLQSTKLMLSERIFEMDNFSLKEIVNRQPLLKYRYIGSFQSHFVPNLSNDTFAIINTQPSNTPGEHWIMVAKFHQVLYFADSLGLFINNYPFLKQNYSPIVQDYKIIPVYAVSTQFMEYFICSSFNKIRLLVFINLMYSLL